MTAARERERQVRRDALWRWRWLGLRDSTPGFKGSLLVLALAAGYIVVHALAR